MRDGDAKPLESSCARNASQTSQAKHNICLILPTHIEIFNQNHIWRHYYIIFFCTAENLNKRDIVLGNLEDSGIGSEKKFRIEELWNKQTKCLRLFKWILLILLIYYVWFEIIFILVCLRIIYVEGFWQMYAECEWVWLKMIC